MSDSPPLVEQEPESETPIWCYIADAVREVCLTADNSNAMQFRLVGLSALAWTLQSPSIDAFLANEQVQSFLGKDRVALCRSRLCA